MAATHREMPAARIGSFIFAASLAAWVGQTPDVVAGLDIIAPMLYRRYPADSGPACLNHEWARLLQMLTERSGLTLEDAVAAVSPWSSLSLDRVDTTLPVDRLTADMIRQEGFSAGQYTRETKALLQDLPPGRQVAPISA